MTELLQTCLQQALVAIHDFVIEPLKAVQRPHILAPDVDVAQLVSHQDLQPGHTKCEQKGKTCTLSQYTKSTPHCIGV